MNCLVTGGSGFLGPVILKKNPDIISIGRTKPPLEIKNEHIHLKSLDNLQSLDSIEFDKVIFLIGSSNHHEINKSITMGLDYNLYPTKKILNYRPKVIFKLNANGTSWERVAETGKTHDRASFWWNPLIGSWVFNLRLDFTGYARSIW